MKELRSHLAGAMELDNFFKIPFHEVIAKIGHADDDQDNEGNAKQLVEGLNTSA